MAQTLIAVDPDRLDALHEEIKALRAELRAGRPPEWVSMTAASEARGVSVDTIRRWVREGRMEARGVGKGRQVRL